MVDCAALWADRGGVGCSPARRSQTIGVDAGLMVQPGVAGNLSIKPPDGAIDGAAVTRHR